MHLQIERKIPCGIEAAWQAECDTRFLNVLSWPFLSFKEQDEQAEPCWREGETRLFIVRFLDLLPLGYQRITVEKLNPETKCITTSEKGTFIRSWHHGASFHFDANPAHCRYRDDISFDADSLSGVVWLSVWVFYRYRQARRAAWARRQNQ